VLQKLFFIRLYIKIFKILKVLFENPVKRGMMWERKFKKSKEEVVEKAIEKGKEGVEEVKEIVEEVKEVVEEVKETKKAVKKFKKKIEKYLKKDLVDFEDIMTDGDLIEVKEHFKKYFKKQFKKQLQDAVNLEMWTIPFYMAAMYSIKDRESDAYQWIRTVINQEMLHLQSAANIANAFDVSVKIEPPVYEDDKVAHLAFKFNNNKEKLDYKERSFSIGPLDEQRINAMCLIELPDDAKKVELILEALIGEYGSIGDFYQVLKFGASLLKDDIKGGINQVDSFSAFYRNMPNMVISESGAKGFEQVELLINLITDQGEGQCKSEDTIPLVFQNTADDEKPDADHFNKFKQIKDLMEETFDKIKTYDINNEKNNLETSVKLQGILIKQFKTLTECLTDLFNGKNPENFFPVMASVGGAIRNCWEHGVTPKFSEPTELKANVEGTSGLSKTTPLNEPREFSAND
ncbi:MAG: ferritin-like domain-containing protein, partial [Colwellia sp.]